MASPDELRFLQWLQDNGATFPKLQWPVATPNGLRGAVATEDIATNEPMLSIPRHLLISEEMCWQDPQLGPVFRSNRDVFTRDDPVMALFIVRELLLEQRSFFHPYLAILPSPESVQDWTHDELRELHDERLVGAAVRRSSEINIYYRRVMTRLQEKYAGEFPETLYTFEKFKFAWKTIQASEGLPGRLSCRSQTASTTILLRLRRERQRTVSTLSVGHHELCEGLGGVQLVRTPVQLPATA
ncbi:putative SET domain-containing protein [Phytophthora infestans]|uniref:Putative SET domain-containing protein n=1 Tax=Phytophthora infestans TaxID=4787 RepID=A0A833WC96_PHYIN|nr:putative SET domain-containing protein [Phytophthora infestans]